MFTLLALQDMAAALGSSSLPFVHRAVFYNFPLYVEPVSPPKAEAQGTPKQGMSPAASGPLPDTAPAAAPSFSQLCLLVDVTASKLKRIGRYNMGRIIGKGAFGTVRLALSTQTGIQPCLAMQSPCQTLFFHMIGHVVACIHHPDRSFTVPC